MQFRPSIDLLRRGNADKKGVVALDFYGHVVGQGDLLAVSEVLAFLWAVEA